VVESTVSALISRAMTLHPCCGHLITINLERTNFFLSRAQQ
jgi:hypothetical protein